MTLQRWSGDCVNSADSATYLLSCITRKPSTCRIPRPASLTNAVDSFLDYNLKQVMVLNDTIPQNITTQHDTTAHYHTTRNEMTHDKTLRKTTQYKTEHYNAFHYATLHYTVSPHQIIPNYTKLHWSTPH